MYLSSASSAHYRRWEKLRHRPHCFSHLKSIHQSIIKPLNVLKKCVIKASYATTCHKYIRLVLIVKTHICIMKMNVRYEPL